MAISALTGTTLVAKAPDAALLTDLLPFLKGLTILFWATASWWIPLLAMLACWQHLIRNFSRRVFVYIALVSWLATLAAMLHSMWQDWRSAHKMQAPHIAAHWKREH